MNLYFDYKSHLLIVWLAWEPSAEYIFNFVSPKILFYSLATP